MSTTPVDYIISRLKADLTFLKEGGHLDAGAVDKIFTLLSPGAPATPNNTNIVKSTPPVAIPSPVAPLPTPIAPKQQVRAIWPYNINNEVRREIVPSDLSLISHYRTLQTCRSKQGMCLNSPQVRMITMIGGRVRSTDARPSSPPITSRRCMSLSLVILVTSIHAIDRTNEQRPDAGICTSSTCTPAQCRIEAHLL